MQTDWHRRMKFMVRYTTLCSAGDLLPDIEILPSKGIKSIHREVLKNSKKMKVKSSQSRQCQQHQHLIFAAVICLLMAVTLIIFSLNGKLLLSPNTDFTQKDTVQERSRCGSEDDAKLILLNSDKLARCMDGSSPGYYLKKGAGDGVDKWHVHFEGGGWCYGLTHCINRARSHLGSSNDYPSCLTNDEMKFYLSDDKAINPIM